MSLRAAAREPTVAHVTTLRGTQLSTDRRNPSKLHRDVLKGFGCPNSQGICLVDGIAVHILFNEKVHSNEVVAWAEMESGAHDSWWRCSIS